MVTVACEAGAVPQVIVNTVRWLMAPVPVLPLGKVLTVLGKPEIAGEELTEQEGGGSVTLHESVEVLPLRTRSGLAVKLFMVGGAAPTLTTTLSLALPPGPVQLSV